MSDFIYEIYPLALDCGVSINDFWQYSITDITDIIKSFTRNKQKEIKNRLIFNYDLASKIQIFVGSLLSKDFEIPSVYDLHPELFEVEKEMLDKERVEKKLLINKERMRAFAEKHNMARTK